MPPKRPLTLPMRMCFQSQRRRAFVAHCSQRGAALSHRTQRAMSPNGTPYRVNRRSRREMSRSPSRVTRECRKYHWPMQLKVRVDGQFKDALQALVEYEDAPPEEIVRRAVFDRYEQTVQRAVLKDASPRTRKRWRKLLKDSK